MLRAGLVGLGRMGLTHLSILNTHPDIEWVAVCDTTPFVLKNLQQRLKFEPFSDARKLIESSRLDLVIVATPTSFHADAIRCAIENGVPAFVEKPLTLSADESKRLAEAAAARGLVTQVGYVNRFNEVFAEARRLLRGGVIGTPLFYKCEMWGRTVLKPTKSGWRSNKSEGGGCLYEFASHCVDLAHFLVGPPDSISGSCLQKIYSARVDDAVYSTFHHAGGTVGQIAVNWSDESCRKPTNRVEIFGSGGRLVAQQHELHVYLREDRDDYGLAKGWTTRYVTDLARPVRFYLRGNEFTRQLDHFVDSVRAGRGSDTVSFADGALVDAVLERIAADSRARA